MEKDSILRRATEALRRHFGFAALKPFQVAAIGAWAEGKDVLLSLGTGAGKSLCFQLPPLVASGKKVAVVISPLISLMQDQVYTLQQRHIHASCCGASGVQNLTEAFKLAEGGVVYMCPEFALIRLEQLQQLKDSVCLLAIDEAHCISAWGHDFRPKYGQLDKIRNALGRPPTMAVTATCTSQVQRDIQGYLGLTAGNLVVVRGSVNRTNLKFLVKPRSSLEQDLSNIFALKQRSEAMEKSIDNTSVNAMSSSIVYVPTRARSEEVSNWLQMKGVKAAAYHAGLSIQARHERHTAFLLDELQVIVATVAYGMGIDKPSIRRVIHYGGVRSLADYMQQCGRAGRDGEEAECITFHRPSDAQEMRQLILQNFESQSQVHQQRLLTLNNEMMAFLADSTQCRRISILQHFGELPQVITPETPVVKGECTRVGDSGVACCHWCDVCLSRADTQQSVGASEADFTSECLILLNCVDACGGLSGRALPIAVAVGQSSEQVRSKKLHQHQVFGSGRGKSQNWWKAFLPHVLRKGLLQERPARLANGRSYAAVSLSEAGRAMQLCGGSFRMCPVPDDLDVTVKVAQPAVVIRSSGGPPVTVTSTSTEKVQVLYRRLSHVRQQWMRRRCSVVGESIISNPLLRKLAELRPTSLRVAQERVSGLPEMLHEDLAELLDALIQEIAAACKDLSLRPCEEQMNSEMELPSKTESSDSPMSKRRRLPWEGHEGPTKVIRSLGQKDVATLEEKHKNAVASKEEDESKDEWLSLLEM